jgi:hypothetical protein
MTASALFSTAAAGIISGIPALLDLIEQSDQLPLPIGPRFCKDTFDLIAHRLLFETQTGRDVSQALPTGQFAGKPDFRFGQIERTTEQRRVRQMLFGLRRKNQQNPRARHGPLQKEDHARFRSRLMKSFLVAVMIAGLGSPVFAGTKPVKSREFCQQLAIERGYRNDKVGKGVGSARKDFMHDCRHGKIK